MNRRLFSAAAAAALTLAGGCHTPEGSTSHKFYHSPEDKEECEKAAAKSLVGPVRQVRAMWDNEVVVTQNSVANGTPLPGLMGKVYFFGEEIGYPRACKGTITIDACELGPDGKTITLPNGNAKIMERWEIDPMTMMKLGRKDFAGWCYTIFLPWSTYRPDIARVQLQVKFVPDMGGGAIFSSPSTVTLLQEGPPLIRSSVIPLGDMTRK